ncbi:SDR family NAD(P)-dependent oxidoreductase [Mycobacterium paraterrae]|uniref:SDR family NAD(P)-dependent oxidoreductase n=1 Tax=Mycobacterium paraterrae TaxID=577492 RepID=A0ABY3VIZ2_9MYCO|nr:SDR family NAD(P)-dependent oxidoreductase [Mycobacterium paraterrae]UMB69276.1 SDR family NAD(P)-dependent oxidoreductase [Mycobacterium paraterrae]
MSRARAVVITEASSPVAYATASRLAAGGHSVLMGSPRPEAGEDLAARLRSAGASVFAAHLDLADPLSIDDFLESVDYLIGDVDALISSAGVAERSWVGAQHLVTQLVSPMIDNGRGDVVLLSPELSGASPAGADRMLDAWIRGLDAEFVGTGVRASIVRSTGAVPADDAGRLIASTIVSSGMHLSVVDVIPSRRESAVTDEVSREMRR